MGERLRVVAALEALPARVWGLVLREVRAHLDAAGGGADALRTLVTGPRSAVAGGPGRTRVAELLADDRDLRTALAALAVLADAAAALTADRGPAAGPDTTADTAEAAPRPRPVDGDGDGGRELRAELARTRRQRDGADARARAAEERADAAAAEVAGLRDRLVAAESALAEAADERTRAVERAGRRVTDRVRDLEAELGSLRSERERLVRDLERERGRTARLRGELEEARAARAAADPTPVAVPRDLPMPRECSR